MNVDVGIVLMVAGALACVLVYLFSKPGRAAQSGLDLAKLAQVINKTEHAVLLAQALERLPKDYREVLILRHLEECAFAEVARRMGRTVESVKKLWARALPRLREELKEIL